MDKFLNKIYFITVIIILFLIIIAGGVAGFNSIKDEKTAAGSTKPDMASAGPELPEAVVSQSNTREEKTTNTPKAYSAAGNDDYYYDKALISAAMGISTDYERLGVRQGAFTWV